MANTPYFDQKIQQLPGGSSIDSFKRKYLDPLNVAGDPGDLWNLGGTGTQTAADAAKAAQAQANALSTLQWQRQMQGLQGAQGYVNNLQSLYNSIYSPGSGGQAAGGQTPSGPTQSQMMSLSAAPQAAPAPAPAASTSGASLPHVSSKTAQYAGGIADVLGAPPVDQVYGGGKGAYNTVKGWF